MDEMTWHKRVGLDVEMVVDGFAGGRKLAGVDVFEQVCPGVLGWGLATELVEQIQSGRLLAAGRWSQTSPGSGLPCGGRDSGRSAGSARTRA